MFRIKYFWALAGILFLISCEDGKYDREIQPPVEVVSGEADFSNYVAIGGSLAAGMSDGALFIASQSHAYPNLLAEKMALAGGGEFTSPWMSDNTGGLLLGGNVIQQPRLFFDGAGLSLLPKSPTTEVSDVHPGPYNNMGIPGAKSFHLLYNGYGDISNVALELANPYYVRMASSPNASVLEDIMAANPTFYTLWLGNNDVLQYAASGGDGSEAITDQATFDAAMGAIVGALSATGAKGIMGNIPNILYSGYFTAVPYAPLDPTDPVYGPQIPTLNAAYAQLNQAFAYLGVPERSVVFSQTAASPVVIHDESLPNITVQLNQVLIAGGLDPLTAGLLSAQYGQSRQANENDLLTLTSQEVLGEVNMEYYQQLVGMGVPAEFAGQLSVNGLTYPLGDTWVLLPTEQEEIVQAIDSFNQTISQLASNAGLPLFDAAALFEDIETNGYSGDGFTLTADFLTGGLLSLDGLHLTARGQAMVANEMMKLIDANYDSNFEEAGVLNDLGDFPMIYSPALQ